MLVARVSTSTCHEGLGAAANIEISDLHLPTVTLSGTEVREESRYVRISTQHCKRPDSSDRDDLFGKHRSPLAAGDGLNPRPRYRQDRGSRPQRGGDGCEPSYGPVAPRRQQRGGSVRLSRSPSWRLHGNSRG